MNLDFPIRLLWSGWFAVGAVVLLVAFVVYWRKRKLTLLQILVTLLLVPIFSVDAVALWFRPSRPPHLIDGILAVGILVALAKGVAKLSRRRSPAKPDASSNGGPAEGLGNSRFGGGPPSVS